MSEERQIVCEHHVLAKLFKHVDTFCLILFENLDLSFLIDSLVFASNQRIDSGCEKLWDSFYDTLNIVMNVQPPVYQRVIERIYSATLMRGSTSP
jgi:hypothetical protein